MDREELIELLKADDEIRNAVCEIIKEHVVFSTHRIDGYIEITMYINGYEATTFDI